MISDLTDPPNWYPDARNIQRKIIFHAGPTNSGKTYHALERYMSAQSGVYCSPLKLLAVEVANKCNARGTPCDLVTGEERKYAREDEEPSSHVSCTVEMTDCNKVYEVAVIDEIQMLKDYQRGWAWTRALLGIPAHEVHVCGEAAAIDLVREMMISTGDEMDVRTYKRLTNLIKDENIISAGWYSMTRGRITEINRKIITNDQKESHELKVWMGIHSFCGACVFFHTGSGRDIEANKALEKRRDEGQNIHLK